MSLLNTQRGFLLFVALLGAPGAFAVTQWVKLTEGDRRCSMTCGRLGMDNIVSGKKTHLGESICAGQSQDHTKLLPGVQKFAQDLGCQISSGQTVSSQYCLFANDGVEHGTDLSWLDPLATSRCDTTCKAQGVANFGYAVYASYVNQSWTHVCMSDDGSVGFTGGGKAGCHTATGSSEAFKCLCTKGFAGDLEPLLNP